MTRSTKAVLFDFGGTLYDYALLETAERESLVELVRSSGLKTSADDVVQAHRAALRQVFRDYLPRSYYLHRDMFRDAVVDMLRSLGANADDGQLDRYRALQWSWHTRDFQLRDGVRETLAQLRARGVQLGLVSNIDDDQLNHLMGVAGLRDAFDWLLSSEQVGSCKPDPAIFAEALRRAGCPPQEVLFVGDTLLQDIAGANRAGMRSVLLWHRDDRPPPDHGPRPHHIIRRISDVLTILE